MKLFYVPGACSLTPHIILREGKFQFELDRIDVKAGKKTQTGGSYVEVNPKGQVPTLVLDNGQTLTEVAVIIQYLADLKPELRLAPANGTFERVRLQEMLNFTATELHKGLAPLYQQAASDEFKAWWKANRVEPRLDHLARTLTGKQFVMGDTFTVADAYAFYVLRAWQVALKSDLTKWPVLGEFFARMLERPSVKAALEAEAAPV